MRNRLYDYICIFILLEILLPTSHAKIVGDTRRTKREVSVAEVTQGNVNYTKDFSLEEKNNFDGDFKKNNTYLQGKRKLSKRSANPDVLQLNADKSIDRTASQLGLNEESDYAEEEAGEEMTKQEDDKDVETSDLVRLPRDVNIKKYTDEDEKSSLYDDYETKDVAKRGILDGPGDYEEEEDDSPGILEDTVALEEGDEGERRETRKSDSRVKRDQMILETFDKSGTSNLAKLEQPKIAESPLTCKVSRAESSKSFNRRMSAPDDSASKSEGSAGPNEVISGSSDSTENKEPASVITSSNEDKSSVEYGKRVEEEIQRKIDSIKEEIKRDIEAQRKMRDIEENNARFDELREQEKKERQNLEGEPIEKRQTKRSIGEIAASSSSSSKKDNTKRCLKGSPGCDKLQHRSSEVGRPDTLKESESLKKRFVINRDKPSGQAPSNRLFKRKREYVRQTFLVNNDRTKKRRSGSYTPSDRTAARPLQASSAVPVEDENNDGEQSPTADHSNSLASLTGSSQELSPRLAREYKEAFGGLQSEPGGALARFKRIKRVLGGPDAKI
ncbi:uncharacterized protein [Anoplolepis gracilipes]|uniref:uncharacterized protein isoform X2 n=1 Tax=Anoplolepis gracilipes TaxID=354296 RepID=UPI003BA07F6D